MEDIKNNDLCKMINSIHECIDVKYMLDGNEIIKRISNFTKKEFLDIFFGGLVNSGTKDNNRYENFIVNGSGVDKDSKLYSKLTQIYGFTKINNREVFRPVILNGLDYLDYLKSWDIFSTRKKWFEHWIKVVEPIWKEQLEEPHKDMVVEKYFFKNSPILSFIIGGSVFMDVNKNTDGEFVRMSPYFLLILDYMMMNCLHKYNNFYLIQKIDEPRNELDRTRQLVYFVNMMQKKGYTVDVFNFSDSYEKLNILLDEDDNWEFKRNKNNISSKNKTTIWFKTNSNMNVDNGLDEKFSKVKYVKSYNVYKNDSSNEEPIMLSFYLDSNRKTKQDVDIFDKYKEELNKYEIIFGDFNTKGEEAANTVLEFAIEAKDKVYNKDSIYTITTNKKRRVPIQTQMGKNGLDPIDEFYVSKIKDWIIIQDGTTEIHIFDLACNEYTDVTYELIPELPKFDHFSDHYVVYRQYIKNGKKYGIAHLNVAADQNSPFEFYIPELRDLYNIIYDDWTSDELMFEDKILFFDD